MVRPLLKFGQANLADDCDLNSQTESEGFGDKKLPVEFQTDKHFLACFHFNEYGKATRQSQRAIERNL